MSSESLDPTDAHRIDPAPQEDTFAKVEPAEGAGQGRADATPDLRDPIDQESVESDQYASRASHAPTGRRRVPTPTVCRRRPSGRTGAITPGMARQSSGREAKSRLIRLYHPIPDMGFFPPTLHVLQSALVRFITICDHFFQVAILRLDNFIGCLSVEWEVAWSAHVSTCHRLHQASYPFIVKRH